MPPPPSLFVEYPAPQNRPPAVRSFTLAEQKAQYFVATIPESEHPVRPQPAAPADVLVVLDTSGSARDLQRAKQAARTISKIRDEGATVHVLNGYGSRNARALDIANRLSAAGMEAVVPPVNEGRADTNDYRATLITAYNSAEEAMPESLKRIKRTFREKGVEVVFADDPEQTADFVVTIGSKTKVK